MKKSWKEHFWHGVPCMRTRIQDIIDRVGTNKNVIEAGCNEGFVSRGLQEAGNIVVSVDNDPVQIEKAKNMFGLTVLNADINDLPFEDNYFDVAVGTEVLEHIANPGKGWTELFRVAKEKVIISLPIGEYWLGEKTHLWEIQGGVIEHDSGNLELPEKHLFILEFIRRR